MLLRSHSLWLSNHPYLSVPCVFYRQDIHYEGPAELYPSPTAIYLKYGDNWLKWKTVKSWRAGRTEHFMGRGETGHLSVLINDNEHASFDALATGSGIHFKGDAQY